MDLTSPALHFSDAHRDAGKAIRTLHERGFDVNKLSLVSQGFPKNGAVKCETALQADKYVRHAMPSTAQALSAMRVSGSDSTVSVASMTRETGPMAAAADRSSLDEATAVRSACAASADSGAQETIALWRAVDLEVSAVIGQRGTAAVLRRALVVMRRTHGWMPEPSDGADFDACVHALSDALARQAPEARASGRHARETAFHDLLASLVGAVLAVQLLRAARAGRPVRLEAVR